MPELPEVETIRRQLTSSLIRAEILTVEVRAAKCFVGAPASLTGETVTAINRVGKYLYVGFASGRGLAIHLKMTGRLVMDVDSYGSSPYTRVVLTLKDGRKLYYWDTRMFGYLRIVEDVQLAYELQKKEMGPEPWNITETELLRRLQKTGRAIKEVLLDQKMLAGVGNIYANDSLWEAGLRPNRKANSLKLSEVTQLLAAIILVFERGLVTGGASDNSYVDATGRKGRYQNEFRVYKGGICKRCGRELIYGKVGGRGTWWCESCQH